MPFSFAWVDEADTFDPVTHGVEDELILSFEVIEEEHNWAILNVEMLTDISGSGFLSVTRKQWVWFSDEFGALFKGRVLGVPQQIEERVIAVTFWGRASDHEARKAVAADALKIGPFFDIAFIAESRRDDPDAVLDARPAYWHVHRLTHAVTTVSAIEADSYSDLTPYAYHDSIELSHTGEPPASEIALTVSVEWEQVASNSIDIASMFPAIETLTGVGLMEDWPLPTEKQAKDYTYGTSVVKQVDGKIVDRVNLSRAMDRLVLTLPQYTFYVLEFGLHYSVVRRRREVVEIVMRAGVQPLIAAPGEDAVIRESMASTTIGEAVDPGGVAPIRDARQSAYFTTPRGEQSLRYCLQVAAAKLLLRARAGELSCSVPYANGRDLTLHGGLTLTDARLPGGTCSAKIRRLRLYGSGEGEFGCEVQGGVMVGTGGAAPTPLAADPVWVETGWVEDGWQGTSGGTALVDGAVGFSSILDTPPNDDGIDFFNPRIEDFVLETAVTNDGAAQFGLLDEAGLAKVEDANAVLRENPTQVCLTTIDIDKGPFETVYVPDITELSVPKMVDL